MEPHASKIENYTPPWAPAHPGLGGAGAVLRGKGKEHCWMGQRQVMPHRPFKRWVCLSVTPPVLVRGLLLPHLLPTVARKRAHSEKPEMVVGVGGVNAPSNGGEWGVTHVG